MRDMHCCVCIPVVTMANKGCEFWPLALAYILMSYCVAALSPVMTAERASPVSARPMALEGTADSRTSTIKFSKAFSPVCQDREKRSEVMFETRSLDKSGSATTKRREDCEEECVCVSAFFQFFSSVL